MNAIPFRKRIVQLQDKIFLITGGRSGLGAETARNYVDAVASVVLADPNGDAGFAQATELGDRARLIECNVCDTSQIEAAIALAQSSFGGHYHAVHCAEVPSARKTVGRDGLHSLESFQDVVNVNLVGAFNVIRLCAATMQDNDPDAGGERGVLTPHPWPPSRGRLAKRPMRLRRAGASPGPWSLLGILPPVAWAS